MASRLDFSQIRSLYVGTTSSTQVGTDNLVVAGNVGIGTTAPGAKLQINDGTGSAEFLRLSVAYDTSRSARGGIYWHDTSNTTGRIYTEYDGTMTSMVFGSLYNSGYNSNNLMIIRGNGNVGIGTDSPANKLSVSQGGFNNAVTQLSVLNTSVAQKAHVTYDTVLIQQDDAPTLRLHESGENLSTTISSDGGVSRLSTSGILAFSVAGNPLSPGWNGMGGIEAMRMIANGNVGIGTTAPNAKLDVAGGINTRNTRVNSAEKYPLGHYSFGETVFEIDPTWTEAQLQDYFNSSGVTWVADSTAPGGYAIQIDGSVNVGAGEYDSGFPYIPVDNSQDDWYYMECYIKNDAGSSIQHYMGGIDFNQSFASLGGNPGSYTYNVMFNYNPGTSWTKVYGYWNGFGGSYGSAGTGNTNNWVSGTKYFTPQALFNYGLNSGIRRCYISGWKCVRVRATGNRYYSNNVLVSGNVGIGTTAPTARLTIGANTSVQSTNGIALGVGETSLEFVHATFQNGFGSKLYSVDSGGGITSLRIATRPNSTSWSDAVTIIAGMSGNGNVGIGNTSPSYRLVVNKVSTAAPAIMVGGAFYGGPRIQTYGLDADPNAWMGLGTDMGVGSYEHSIYYSAYNNYGKLTFGTYDGTTYSTKMLLNASGNLGIGTTSPGYKLDVSGTIRATGDVIAYSDARVKENVETLDGALDKVMKMRGVSYNKIGEQEKKVGVIAQEILEVLPEVVSQDESGTYSVAYGNIVSVLIEAIKEQQKQIDELKAKLK